MYMIDMHMAILHSSAEEEEEEGQPWLLQLHM
jgi:hypothetical protein